MPKPEKLSKLIFCECSFQEKVKPCKRKIPTLSLSASSAPFSAYYELAVFMKAEFSLVFIARSSCSVLCSIFSNINRILSKSIPFKNQIV